MASRHRTSEPTALEGRRTGKPASGDAEVVWGPERPGRRRVYGPFYRSGYLGTFFTGRIEDGGELAVVAGIYGRHFPYFHPRSRWDGLLVLAGGERLAVATRRISTLNLGLGPGPLAVVGYHGRAFRASGRVVDLDLHLEFRARVFPARPQGLGRGRMLLGLEWQPALIEGHGSIRLQGKRRRIERAEGIVERGSLSSLRGRAFELGFDYFAAAGLAARERSPGGPGVYVRLRIQPLHRGVAGLPLRILLPRGRAAEELTLAGTRPEPGDIWGLAPRPDEPVEPLLADRLDLGPAFLSRQLLRLGEGDRRRYAFHQRTEAKR
jgi:hypothetical protein